MSLDRSDDKPIEVILAEKGFVRGPGGQMIKPGPDSPLHQLPVSRGGLSLVKPKRGKRGASSGSGRVITDDTIDPLGLMNGWERQRAGELEVMQRAKLIRWWLFGSFALRLARATFYHPDFMLLTSDGAIEFEEVKGHWEDDARVKIKVAARMYPQFRFRAIQRKTKKQGGGWKIEAISA